MNISYVSKEQSCCKDPVFLEDTAPLQKKLEKGKVTYR